LDEAAANEKERWRMTDDTVTPPEIMPASANNPDDLSINRLVWLLANLVSINSEYTQNTARETLAKYGLDEKSAHRLLREKRKRRR
jgi:hypothetical protein